MFLSNLSNPTLLSDSLCKNLSEVQIQSCILDEMSFSNTCWNEVSLNNSNANQSLYEKLFIGNSSFTNQICLNLDLLIVLSYTQVFVMIH
jgi:hypothetical protein